MKCTGLNGGYFKSVDGITWEEQPDINSSSDTLIFNSIATDGDLMVVTGGYPDSITNVVFFNKL